MINRKDIFTKKSEIILSAPLLIQDLLIHKRVNVNEDNSGYIKHKSNYIERYKIIKHGHGSKVKNSVYR